VRRLPTPDRPVAPSEETLPCGKTPDRTRAAAPLRLANTCARVHSCSLIDIFLSNILPSHMARDVRDKIQKGWVGQRRFRMVSLYGSTLTALLVSLLDRVFQPPRAKSGYRNEEDKRKVSYQKTRRLW
jgi:hypothetical protein